jgi:hypothetical protein
MSRITELFLFAMPRAMMLDEVEQILFRINFWSFLERWVECQKNVSRWSEKDREYFLRDMRVTETRKHKQEGEVDGKDDD